MSQDDAQIGKRLAQARKNVGLTQQDLEKATGISQPTIYQIETGAHKASILELSALADACGVLVADLLGENDLSKRMPFVVRTNDKGVQKLVEYMIYAFGISQRLDKIGVP